MNVLICGGVFMVKQQPNRKGQAADAVRSGSVMAGASLLLAHPAALLIREGVLPETSVQRTALVCAGRVSLFREAKGRVCVYPAFRAGRGAHFASCRSLPSDERLGYRLRFENAVRYDGNDDGRVFHKNEQK